MGRVYEARDPELGRKVAIKVLHAHHTSLFRGEARALATLNHPGIVTIHEIGEHEGRPYLVMELLVGRPLRELLLAEAVRPPRGLVLEICAHVARAIAEAHERGVLHRDIKPENVVVLASGGVKVIDFGIARRLEEDEVTAGAADESRAARVASAFARTMPVEVTPSRDPSVMVTERDSGGAGGAGTVVSLGSSTQTVFGTPAYMAPEVLGGGPSTPASDVYSLGVMAYECLANRRPYEAPDLVGVVAMVLDGTKQPPPLADALAPFVMRMLDRDPARRPSLQEVNAALEPPARAPQRRTSSARRATVLVGLLALGTAGAIAAWRSQSSSVPAPTTQVRQPAGAIALAPIEVAYQTYGDQPSNIALVLGLVLGHIADIRVIEPSQLEGEGPKATDRAASARRLGARYLLEGTLVEKAGAVTGTLELRDLTHDTTEVVKATLPVTRNAALVIDLANQVADHLVPGARLDPASNEVVARKLYEVGFQHLQRQQWSAARPYLEQAVEADPRSARAWDAVTTSRAWTLAPQPLIEDGVTRTLAASPVEPRRTILQGAGQFFGHEYDAAVATLEPLATDPSIVGDNAIDVAYYLGEALWHRGDYARGAALLQRVLDARRAFQPAGVHLMQHALTHRELTRAGVLVGQLGRARQVYEFAAGDYVAVAASSEFPLNLHAQIVLGKPASELEARLGGYDGAAYAIATAIVAGDKQAARAHLATIWTQIAKQPVTDRLLYQLGELIDVVVSSGLRDETRTMLELLRSGASPRYRLAHRRAAALAAPLIGMRLPDEDGATPRQRRLLAAMRAELAGDRKQAAALLTELVADPSDTFDIGERIALVRNLRALGDERGVRAQCKEIERPPVFRFDFVLARATCR